MDTKKMKPSKKSTKKPHARSTQRKPISSAPSPETACLPEQEMPGTLEEMSPDEAEHTFSEPTTTEQPSEEELPAAA